MAGLPQREWTSNLNLPTQRLARVSVGLSELCMWLVILVRELRPPGRTWLELTFALIYPPRCVTRWRRRGVPEYYEGPGRPMPVSSTSLQAPREASLSRTVNSSPARTWGGIEAQRRRSVRRAPANTVRDLRPLVRREVSTTDGSCATWLIFDNSVSNVHYPLARVRTSSNVPRPPLIELAHQACVRARASELCSAAAARCRSTLSFP